MDWTEHRSPAKVNLHLQVVGRRPDGYHELRTVFQTIDLEDRIELALGGRGVEIECRGAGLPFAEENLAVRAARLFASRWAPRLGIRLRLDKRIPVGGGLGGGSSNAATVLLALRERCGFPATREELWEAARSLGADVPYFLLGGAALGIGRGDELVPLPEPPLSRLWLAVPPLAIDTGRVFRSLPGLTEAPLAPSIRRLLGPQRRGPSPLGDFLGHNDLQATVFRLYPEVATVYDSLVAAGACWVSLSGSGACLVARFRGVRAGELARKAMPPGVELRPVFTLSRRAWLERWPEGRG